MTRSVPPSRSTSTAMAPRRAGSRRSWPRSRVADPGHRHPRQHGDPPGAPCSRFGAAAPAAGRPRAASPTRSPKGPAGQQHRAPGRGPPARRRGRWPPGPGHGQLLDPVTEGVAHPPGQRLPVGRGPASPGGRARRRRAAGRLPTTSKGRPNPSTPPWTLKLATTTSSHRGGGYRAADRGRLNRAAANADTSTDGLATARLRAPAAAVPRPGPARPEAVGTVISAKSDVEILGSPVGHRLRERRTPHPPAPRGRRERGRSLGHLRLRRGGGRGQLLPGSSASASGAITSCPSWP